MELTGRVAAGGNGGVAVASATGVGAAVTAGRLGREAEGGHCDVLALQVAAVQAQVPASRGEGPPVHRGQHPDHVVHLQPGNISWQQRCDQS